MRGTAKRRTSPRKAPRQSRSKALVDAIVEAATRILPDQGLDRTTTNRIAEVAGVSIGSLYQYFPNKDAIVAHLIERDLASQERVYRTMVEQMRDQPLREVVACIIEHATDRYLGNEQLVRSVFLHAIRVDRLKTVLETRKSVGAAFAQLIRERPGEVDVEDAEQATSLLIDAVMGIYQMWVLTDPSERMSCARLNRHLTRLILGYLGAAAG